jgi:hypothetical protein
MANEEKKKEMTETEKLARTPNVSIATPTYNKEQVAQKIDADDANPQKQVTDVQDVNKGANPTTPSEADQLKAEYESKQALNRSRENAISQIHDRERADAQRKQRNRQIVNSIADGLSAVSNIVTTAHGAPDLGIGKTLLTQKSQERYDKLYKDAEDRRKEYLKIVREGNKEDLSNWYTMQKDATTQRIKERETKVKEAEQKRKEREEERKTKIGEIELQYKMGKLTEQEYKTELAKVQAEHADEYWDAKVGAENRRGRSSGGSGGNSKGNGYITVNVKNPLLDENGNLIYDQQGRQLFGGYTTRRLYYNTPEYYEYMNSINGGNSSNNKNNNGNGGNNSSNKKKEPKRLGLT